MEKNWEKCGLSIPGEGIGSVLALLFANIRFGAVWVVVLLWSAGCTPAAPSLYNSGPHPTGSNSDVEIVVYGWAGYMPEEILDRFTQANSIEVRYVAFESYEEAIDLLRSGSRMDVLIIGSEQLESLIHEGLLAEIDYRNVPNFRNISVSFRDLAFDPNNVYSVPFQWGTTGLIVRTDLVDRPITKWADLWDPAFAGRVAVWPIKRDLIGMTLKSLGYSINSEDADELAEAGERLAELAARVTLLDINLAHAAEQLVSGRVVMIYGWPYDYQEARIHTEHVEYILPEEGTILWVENLVIPASSRQKAAAEKFINYLLAPEIAALLVNEIYVAIPNDPALDLIDPEILEDWSIFPDRAQLANGEILLGIDGPTVERHDVMWQEFLAYYE